jgi:hypothetical protein
LAEAVEGPEAEVEAATEAEHAAPEVKGAAVRRSAATSKPPTPDSLEAEPEEPAHATIHASVKKPAPENIRQQATKHEYGTSFT